jgi:hypothetical protein
MSLHLGNDFVISTKQIISILNIHGVTGDGYSPLNIGKKSFVRKRKIGPGPYRSAVLCCKGTVYLSPIDSTTLSKRFIKENVIYIK